jgi:putative flippase GtrA
MNCAVRLTALRLRFLHGWRKGAISRKAVSFALIGIVNAFVDYGVFFLARAVFAQWPAALALFAAISGACRCAGADTVSFIVANLTSWAVAVTGSYILNASITFAAESGRKLRWRAYAVFAASGIAGWLANTAALVFAAQVLLLPIALAKAIAILASFAVNFTLSHYVVFRVRHRPALDGRQDASSGGAGQF